MDIMDVKELQDGMVVFFRTGKTGYCTTVRGTPVIVEANHSCAKVRNKQAYPHMLFTGGSDEKHDIAEVYQPSDPWDYMQLMGGIKCGTQVYCASVASAYHPERSDGEYTSERSERIQDSRSESILTTSERSEDQIATGAKRREQSAGVAGTNLLSDSERGLDEYVRVQALERLTEAVHHATATA